MRHSARERNIKAVIAVIAFASFAVAPALPPQARNGTLELALGAGGLMIGITAGVMAIVAHFRDVSPHRRMQRNEGVLARWQINAARWKTFTEHCQTITHGSNALSNSVEVPSAYPGRDIEVVISNNAICLDGDFHPIKASAKVRRHGPVLEIFQEVQAGKTSTRPVAYRLPTPESADPDVERIIQNYAASNVVVVRRGRKVAFALLAFSMVLLGIVLWIAFEQDASSRQSAIPPLFGSTCAAFIFSI